jgi:hypothetical protein
MIAPRCLPHREVGAEGGNRPWAEVDEPVALELRMADTEPTGQEICVRQPEIHELPAAEARVHKQIEGRQAQSRLAYIMHGLANLRVGQISRERLSGSEVMPAWVDRIGARPVDLIGATLSLEFEPHAQRHQPPVNRRPSSAQRLLPYDELVDVRTLDIRDRALPPSEKETDITDVMNNGRGPWKSATQVSCERDDRIDHACTAGGELSPALHQGCRNLM